MASYFNEDLHSTDSDDDDYVPDAGEVSSDEDNEDPVLSDDEFKTKKRSEKNNEVLHSEEKKTKPIEASLSNEESKIDEKQRADDLFKSFLEEVAADVKVKENESTPGGESAIVSTPENKSPVSGIPNSGSSLKNAPEKNVCELFDFAGETVAVSVKDGAKIASTESSSIDSDSTRSLGESMPDKPANELPVKRKGIQGVLGTIMNKNKKLSVLDKTSLDWAKFKKDHDIAEELETYNKGRGGFVERQRFLQRSDLRSYEIERDMRMAKRKKNC